jgi:hypothetical protein
MWINEKTLGTFVLHGDIRHELWKSQIEAPGVLTDEYLASVGYKLVTQVHPTFNPITHSAKPNVPVLENGTWVQYFAVEPLDPAIVANNCYSLTSMTPEITAILETAGFLTRIQGEIEVRRISRLWQAAHDYESKGVTSTVAILLMRGIVSGKPKALAVQAWVDSIWAEYYTRKASGSDNFNFSPIGPCPHTVRELSEELSA